MTKFLSASDLRKKLQELSEHGQRLTAEEVDEIMHKLSLLDVSNSRALGKKENS